MDNETDPLKGNLKQRIYKIFLILLHETKLWPGKILRANFSHVLPRRKRSRDKTRLEMDDTSLAPPSPPSPPSVDSDLTLEHEGEEEEGEQQGHLNSGSMGLPPPLVVKYFLFLLFKAHLAERRKKMAK